MDTTHDLHNPSATAWWVKFRINPEEVMASNVDAVVHRLRGLSDTAHSVENFRNRVVPHFAALDLSDPDVCAVTSKFMRLVTNEWPYWFHFIPKDLRCLRMVLSLLCESQPVGREERGILFTIKSRNEVYTRAAELLEGVYTLYRKLEFTENHCQTVSDDIVPLLYAAFPKPSHFNAYPADKKRPEGRQPLEP